MLERKYGKTENILSYFLFVLSLQCIYFLKNSTCFLQRSRTCKEIAEKC